MAGFTLVEIMVAIAILGVAVLALASRQREAVRDSFEARERQVEWTLLSRALGEVSLDPRLAQGHFEGTFDERPEYSWTAEVEEEEVELDPDDPDYPKTKLLRARVQLLKEGRSDPVAVLETYLEPPREAQKK